MMNLSATDLRKRTQRLMLAMLALATRSALPAALLVHYGPAVASEDKNLERYVGNYQTGPYYVLTITKHGDHLLLTGQQAMNVYPENRQTFATKSRDVAVTFDTDVAGTVDELVLHQSGVDILGKKIDGAETKRIERELKHRFMHQIKMQGTEAAVRRNIGEMLNGNVNYDRMNPYSASAIRQRLPKLQAMLKRYGTLQTLKFEGVGAGGADIYYVNFEHGTAEWRIILNSDGTINSANVLDQSAIDVRFRAPPDRRRLAD